MGRSLLVYDAFEAHVTDRVKALLKREKTDLAVIPGRLTSILQPLDVSLNKPFKVGVRRRWMQWMDLLFDSAEDTELDDSFIRELFELDFESEFEGFVV